MAAEQELKQFWWLGARAKKFWMVETEPEICLHVPQPWFELYVDRGFSNVFAHVPLSIKSWFCNISSWFCNISSMLV